MLKVVVFSKCCRFVLSFGLVGILVMLGGGFLSRLVGVIERLLL